MKTNYHLQHKDLEYFQLCPLIINKFQHHLLDNQNIYETAVRSILTSEFLDISTYNNIVRAYMQSIKNIPRTENWSLKKFNDLNMIIKRFYSDYTDEFKIDNFKIVAVEFPLHRNLNKAVYSTSVPAVLVNLSKEIIPLFIAENHHVSRNNKIRFSTILLEEKFNTKINEIVIISVPSGDTGPISIHRLPNRMDKDKILIELDNVLELFEQEYNTPNTLACGSCPVAKYCRL